MTKCDVLWLLRSQPAFEASRQGPEPTGQSAKGQEVLAAQWLAQTVTEEGDLWTSQGLSVMKKEHLDSSN